MYETQGQMVVDGPRGPVALAPVWTPEKWQRLSESQRQFVYAAHTDFEFYLYRVFLPFHSEVEGEAYPPSLPWHLSQFARDVQDSLPPELVPFEKPHPRENIVCCVLPTGFGKSMTCYALCAWLIGINRNVSILAASASAETAVLTATAVKHHICENPRHVDVFGPGRLPGSTELWQQRKFTVDRLSSRPAPTLFAAGAEGEIEGRRFDVAILDDVTTARNSATPQMRLRVKEWVNKVVWARLHPERRLMVVVGTMHHGGDYLADLRQKGLSGVEGIRYREYPAILRGQWPPMKIDPSKPYSLDNVVFDEELELLWPEFWTAERLFEDWLNDPGAFALTRQHRVLADEERLFPEVLLVDMCRANGEVNAQGVRRPCIGIWQVERSRAENIAMLAARGLRVATTVLAIDPAATSPRGGTDPDYTACELWVRTEDNVNVLVWLDRFRTGDPQLARERLTWMIKALEPDWVIYEAQAMERYFAVDLAHEVGVPVLTRGLHATKSSEIAALAGYAASGMLLYAWGDEQARAMMSVFEDELSEFPKGRHDDTVTAALHAFHVLRRGATRDAEAVVVSPSDNETEDEWAPGHLRGTGRQAGLSSRFAGAFPMRFFRPPRRMM